MREFTIYSAEEIPYGGYIAEDVYDNNNVLFLAKGTLIDNVVFEKIKQYAYEVRVYTLEEDEPIPQTDNYDNNEITFTLSEDIKERARQGVEYIFNNPESTEIVGVAEDISSEIVEAINMTDNICVNIFDLKICDDYTFKHSVDVATMAVLMAKRMNMPEDYKRDIGLAGILHDLGKTKIPEEILLAPRKLTDEEFNIIKRHPVYGYDLIKNNKSMSDRAKIGVLTHHEKMDGTGYPTGLKGNQINFIGKMMSCVDVYDALVTRRPYRDSAIEPATVVEMMMAMTNQFDINVLSQFLQCVVLYPSGTYIVLSDNRIYQVVRQNVGYPLRPIVFDVLEKREVNMMDMENFHLVILRKLMPDNSPLMKEM